MEPSRPCLRRLARLHRAANGLLLGMSCILAGCAGYSLGPTNGMPAGSQSVQVNPFVNKILEEPRLSEAVTLAVRKQLQQDGTFKLDTKNEGDIIVEGTLIDFDRTSLTFQPRDTLTPRDYRIFITAQVTARERATGKLLVRQNITGGTTIRTGADLPSVERQAVPLVAEDLARHVTDLLVDGKW